MLGMRGRQKKVSETEPVPLLRPVPMLDVCVFGRARYCHDVHGQTKRGRSTLGLPRDDYVIARKRKESDVNCRGWHVKEVDAVFRQNEDGYCARSIRRARPNPLRC